MARQTISELEQRILELEAQIDTLQSAVPLEIETAAAPVRPAWKQRSAAWTLLATTLVVIGALLAPVAIVASWTRLELTDTDRFVAAYAPLARVPAVQDYISSQAVQVIETQVDIRGLTSDVIDGVIALGTPERATKALELLKGPAASGLETLIEGRVDALVRSAVFRRIWADALRVTHTQLQATMRNDPDAAVELGADGTIGIQLAPIITAARNALIADGLTFASQIPTIDRTIVVARSDAIPTVQLAYNLAIGAGTWLPVVSIVFLAAGVLVARRRSLTLVWAAVALGVTTGALALALVIGRGLFVLSVSPGLLPGNLSPVLFDTVVGSMKSTAIAVFVFAVAIVVLAWFGGPFPTPTRLRGFARDSAAALRRAAAAHGITTGRAGTWIWEQRVLVRVAIIVIACVVIFFSRPLTIGLILGTAVLSLLAVAILELVQNPTPTALADDDGDRPGLDESPVSGEGALVDRP